MNKKCKVCAYLSKYEDEDTVYYLNSIINRNFLYKDIEKDCTNKPVPDEYSFKKHQQECLKGFVVKELSVNENDEILDHKSSNKISSFTFKNHDDESGESRVINLKKEWLSISEKLTQIVSYNISKYNPDKVTTSENIKETVANLKTISDLTRSEFTFEFLNKEIDMFEILNDEEVKIVNEIVETAKKRQL